MRMNRRCLFVLLILNSLAWPVWADFDVIDNTPPSDDYGNAQTGSFHNAITGGSAISAQEQQDLAALLPERLEERYYGRVRMNFSSLTFENLRNHSAGSDSGGAINKKRTTDNLSGLELAIGYSWSENFRGDLEYLVNKNLNYSASPVLSGAGVTPRELDAIIKNNTVLANVYYDFAALERFKPYVTGGIGVSVNSIQATLTPAPSAGASNTQRALRISWALGAGMRIGIFSHWYMDLSYRYIRLGNGLNLQPNQSFKLLGDYSSNAFSLGVIYLF